MSKTTEKIIIGALMKKPLLLAQSDKYLLTIDDFNERVMQHIYYAIANIASDGATKIQVQDVDIFLSNSPTSKAIFDAANGIELLNDSIHLANEQSFDTYYNLLKKENLLRDLNREGFDTSDFYEKNPITNEAIKVNDKFNELTSSDILEDIKKKILEIENKYLTDTAIKSGDIYDGLEELLDDLELNPDIGLPLQGEIFNTVVSGARKGKLYVRSAGSGVGKTRHSVGDASSLAFPVSYNDKSCKWEISGYNEKVMMIVTEQERDEIQTLVLAFLTGLNEKIIKRKRFATKEQKKLISQAAYIMKVFRNNFQVVQIPNPSIQSVKTLVRKKVITNQVEFIFYDYIQVSPSLLNEFRGFNLRNDEALLMFTTALKDLAVELDVFIMSATQVNAKADDAKEIRNESTIAGARAIINKADIGCVMARPNKEEMKVLSESPTLNNIIEPNLVTDIYKNRGDEWTQVRIWTYMDLGTLRKQDLFITNSRLETINTFEADNFDFSEGLLEECTDILIELNKKG